MLENWPTLLVGAGGGILTSSAVQYVSHRFDKKREREHREEMWYMEVINNTRALRRRAKGLDPNLELPERVRTQNPEEIEDKELAQVVTLIEELRSTHDQMPIQFYDSLVDERLSEITRFYDSSTIGEAPEDLTDLKENLVKESEGALDAVEKEYGKAPDLY